MQVQDQRHIDFVVNTVLRKIAEQKTKRKRVEIMVGLARSIDLSYATLYNILKNKQVTHRTVQRMISAGWFTRSEFDSARAEPRQEAKQTSSKSDDYSDGYDSGFRAGFLAGSKKVVKVAQSISLDTEKLTKLFNLRAESNSPPGEVTAAKNAASKIISRWIKETFNQEAEVKIS